MKVGSLVECIITPPILFGASDLIYGKEPSRGDVLTVRGIEQDITGTLLTFEEIINRHAPIGGEWGYNIEFFRELQPPMDLTELLEETIDAPNVELCDATAAR